MKLKEWIDFNITFLNQSYKTDGILFVTVASKDVSGLIIEANELYAQSELFATYQKRTAENFL